MMDTTSAPQPGRINKTFLFQLPFQTEQILPPTFDLRKESEEKERRSRLIDDARVEYKLTARWVSGGTLSLWSQYVHRLK